MVNLFFDITPQGIILRVRLQPNSSCCRVNGLFTSPDGTIFLKINIVSIPEKGKANRELIDWLAKTLRIPKSAIQIISGGLDRYKKILITTNKDIILPQLAILATKEIN